MTLVITERDRRFQPGVTCDHCGGPITQAADGNYEYWSPAGPPAESPLRVLFAHKRCTDALERSHRPVGEAGTWATMDLDYLCLYLGNALGVDWRNTIHRAAMLHGFDSEEVRELVRRGLLDAE